MSTQQKLQREAAVGKPKVSWWIMDQDSNGQSYRGHTTGQGYRADTFYPYKYDEEHQKGKGSTYLETVLFKAGSKKRVNGRGYSFQWGLKKTTLEQSKQEVEEPVGDNPV